MNDLVTRVRESKDMNQTEFAEAIGISKSMLSMLESGEREPGDKTLKGLFEVATGHNKELVKDAILRRYGILVVREEDEAHGD